MLIQQQTIYALPGWGFNAAVFDTLNNPAFNLVGLDYLSNLTTSLVDIAEELASKLPDQSLLLGWSFGGVIAIQLAYLFPKKVKKLILIASQPKLQASDYWIGIDQNDAREFLMNLVRDVDKQMNYFINLVCYPNQSRQLKKVLQQYLLSVNANQLVTWLRVLFNTDLSLEYQNLTQPVLQLIHTQDVVIPQNKQQLQRLNPMVNVISLEKLGHAGFLLQPITYINIIMAFLNEYTGT